MKTSDRSWPRRINRRQLTRGMLSASGMALTSLSLPGLLAQRAAAAALGAQISPSIRSCIFVFYYGGPSHLDTYDLKPAAPSTVRGEFKPISTTVPGIQISEHLPQMARVMHKCAVIRSMHHTNRLHDSASIETHTGRQAAQGDREEFAPIEQFFPCHGATLSYLRPTSGLAVSHAALPFIFKNVIDVPCQGGGFLGSTFDPFRIAVDPDQQTYAVPELQLQTDLPSTRIHKRLDLLSHLKPPTQEQIHTGVTNGTGLDSYFVKALELLGSEQVREALDLSRERPEVRERYGIYPTTTQGGTGGDHHGFARHMRGQNLLVARRLVEIGVPFVNVYDFRQQGQNWDSHANNFSQHKDVLLPPADRALAALISDLDERGLLDSTLVVATGEFGRTPQINRDAGRDHWPDCYSVLLAGGGVTGGSVYGSSDSIGAFPETDPVTPADLAATIFWRFGLEPEHHVPDRTQRPWRIAEGQPIRSLFEHS